MNPLVEKTAIDLQNRIGASIAKKVHHAFLWWRGGSFSKMSIVYVAILLAITAYMATGFIGKDLTQAYTSSAVNSFANFLHTFGFSKRFFFSFISIVGLCLGPLSVFLFVRKIAHRHELTAFLTAFLFVIPNPFFGNASPEISAILQGDGGHMLAFPLMLIVTLYAQSFIAKGVSAWLMFASVGIALVALLSPFASFNLILMIFCTAIAEGFLGHLRIKFARFVLLILFSVGLCFFWYFPNVIVKIFVLEGAVIAWQKFWNVFPLLFVIIPVFGTLSFLIFDGRPKIKPIFISISFFAVYFFLFTASKAINTEGIFVADRYIIELAFATSLLFAFAFIFLFGTLYVRLKNYIAKTNKNSTLFGVVTLASFAMILLSLITFANVEELRKTLLSKEVMTSIAIGIGNIQHDSHILDVTGIVADLISLCVAILLIRMMRKFPSFMKDRQTHPAQG